jgi:hypothetical protein
MRRPAIPYAYLEALTFLGACSLLGGVVGTVVAWCRTWRA